MENLIKKYIQTTTGEKALNCYKIAGEISPQNLYVENSDFVQRYVEEHKLLIQCIYYFYNNGIDAKFIIHQIPEILKFYPFICEYDFANSDFAVQEHIAFYDFLKENIIQFYNKINPRQYGEYYTSLEIVNVALKEVDINMENTIIDPSCGSGFILYAYLQKLLKNKNKLEPQIILQTIQNNLFGFDVFPSAVIMTKLLLGYSFISNFEYIDNVFSFRNVTVKNTLSTLKCKNNSLEDALPQFDLVIGNPPFFRIDPKGAKNICRCTQYGHHYAHSLFLHWTLQYLNLNGTFCLILPESMLTGHYYQKVRKELVENASINNIIINNQHEKSFDVQQDVMILVGQKGKMKKYYYTTASDLNTHEFKKFKLPTSIIDNSYNVIPVIMNEHEFSILNDISKNEIVKELGDFSISTGNFVWNQNKNKCFITNGTNRKPLISGPSIVDESIIIEHNRKNSFMYCEPDKPHYTMNKKAIVFRRMSPMEKEKRFMGAIIKPEEITEYVVENHVNIIHRKNSEEVESLYNFLNTYDFNIILKMFCRTNQVSVSDLNTIFEILSKMKKEQTNV